MDIRTLDDRADPGLDGIAELASGGELLGQWERKSDDPQDREDNLIWNISCDGLGIQAASGCRGRNLAYCVAEPGLRAR